MNAVFKSQLENLNAMVHTLASRLATMESEIKTLKEDKQNGK